MCAFVVSIRVSACLNQYVHLLKLYRCRDKQHKEQSTISDLAVLTAGKSNILISHIHPPYITFQFSNFKHARHKTKSFWEHTSLSTTALVGSSCRWTAQAARARSPIFHPCLHVASPQICASALTDHTHGSSAAPRDAAAE